MQPSAEEFREWRGHPVTEWVMSCMSRFADEQKAKWSELAWKGDLDPVLLKEAQTRADCYRAIPDSSHDDWKAIDDPES